MFTDLEKIDEEYIESQMLIKFIKRKGAREPEFSLMGEKAYLLAAFDTMLRKCLDSGAFEKEDIEFMCNKLTRNR